MSNHQRTAPLFVLNGLFATGVQYGSLVTLVEFVHLPSVGIANGVASLFGIGASYLGNRFMVFRSPMATSKTLPRFVLLYGIIALLNALAMWLWSDIAGLPYTPGFLLATAVATMVSYLGNRYFVFSSSEAGTAHA